MGAKSINYHDYKGCYEAEIILFYTTSFGNFPYIGHHRFVRPWTRYGDNAASYDWWKKCNIRGWFINRIRNRNSADYNNID